MALSLYDAFQSQLAAYAANTLSIPRTANDSVSGLLAELSAHHGSIVGRGGAWDTTVEQLLESAVTDAGYHL